jgi:hypothetical protein
MYKIINYNQYWNLIMEDKVQLTPLLKYGDNAMIVSIDEKKPWKGVVMYLNDLTIERKVKKDEKVETVQDPLMTWKEADAQCKKLGEGWRMPTVDEFKKIWANSAAINQQLDVYKGSKLLQVAGQGTSTTYTFYWSQEKQSENFPWTMLFKNGQTFAKDETTKWRVRPVKSVVNKV